MALLVAIMPKTFFQAQETIAAILERASKLVQEQIVETSPDHEASKTLLNVASQVSILVANLKVACTHLSQMNQTYEKVSSAVKDKIALLGTWCTDLEAKNITALKSRGAIDQTFQDKSLGWMPRIDTLSLQVVNSSQGRLTVTGYFPYGNLKKWEHSFIFNKKRFDRAEGSKKDCLTYDLDLLNNSVQEKQTVLTGTLRVDWQNSYLVTKYTGWETSEFPCVFSVIPSIGEKKTTL